MTRELRIKDLSIGDKFKTRSGSEVYEVISDTRTIDGVFGRMCKVLFNNDIFEKEMCPYIKISKL
nr:MAG TPA: hypothetical protein [Caudoviricetes sp.]